MKNKFLKVTREGHFFDKHKKVLIAVSAGKDSMALLECLQASKEELKIEIGIVHINHKQRPESDEEESYLRDFASQKHIPFYIATYKSPIFSEKKARDFRYDFFKKIMLEEGYTALVTAHHADDQAETIFMRLLRGSRLRHLSGIASVQDFGPGKLIRPFLSFNKSELTPAFYFEDASNKDYAYLRNRIRNHYLPQLSKENPQISAQLIELGRETDYLFTALRELTKDVDIKDISVFKQQSPEIQYFLLQDYIGQFPDLQLSKQQFEEVLNIIRTKANYYHHLKENYYLVKDYQKFEISKILPETDEKMAELVIKSNEIVHFGNAIFSLHQELVETDQTVLVEKDVPVRLRYRKPGDKIWLNGKHKKIRRYFIDEKVPLRDRQEAIIIEQENEILAIANMVTSDLSKSSKDGIIKAKLYIKMKE